MAYVGGRVPTFVPTGKGSQLNIEDAVVRELSLAMQAEREIHPRDHSMLHASAIGYCRRKQGYELMGVKGERADSHFLSICDVGHGVHGQLQKRLVDVLGWVEPENIERQVQDEKEGIGGHLDALSKPLVFDPVLGTFSVDWDKGTHYVIDIKTITSRPHLKHHPDTGMLIYSEPSSFERLVAPKKEHLLQTNLYSWMVKDMLTRGFPKIMLIYIGKDIGPNDYTANREPLLSIPYKVFIRDTEEQYIEAALKRARHIWKRVRDGELPGKDHWHKPTSPAWQCEVCPYRKLCYADEGYFENEPMQILPSSLIAIDSYAAAGLAP